jgi:multidrug efflux pump
VNLTGSAIKNNRITIVVLLIILLSGISAYNHMPRNEDPGFIIRTAVVQTIFPGASPERIEQLITDKLEKAIQEMPEIDFIGSTSRSGVSVIYVNIKENYKQMRPIWDDLRRKVERVRPNLPDGVIGPTVNDEFGDVFGTIITLTGEGFSYSELKDIADECRNELLLIDEVAKVDIYGIQNERIFVEYNNSRLAELGLSPSQLKNALESRNIIIPGGEIYTDDEQIILEPTGNFESVEDLRQTVVRLPGQSEVVYLRDLAYIYRGYIDPPSAKMFYSGTPALGLAINLREGGNIIILGEKVKEQVARFQESYPIGIDFEFVAFQPYFVDKKVNEFMNSLLQAVIIVLLVMLISLGFRTGLVVASLIPMAMISAILVMSFLKIGLDQMSLASLMIALGMLVDNSIVMSESISVQIREGKKPLQAAIDSARELRIPLLTSSLTTAAAFLPIFLAESTTGEYTAPLFKVVTITLLCSWILSLTMTPLFCVKFLKIKPEPMKESFTGKYYRAYRKVLMGFLRRPLLSLLGVLLVFFITMFGFRFIPNIFFPPNDKPIFFAELKLPIGTPLKKTDMIVNEIERYIKQELIVDSSRTEGIIDWATFIGEGAPRYVLAYSPEPASPHYGYMVINATSVRVIQDVIIPKLDAFCTTNFPDLTATIRLLFLGAPVDAPVEVRISGKDEDRIFAIVDQVKVKMDSIPGLRNITDNWGARTKKLVVRVNQDRAHRAGLTNTDIAVSLQTVLSGIQTTDYKEEDEVIPITLRSVAAERTDISKLESHNIFSQVNGNSVPLKQVADVEVAWQPAKILRRDRLKTVTIQANIASSANAIAIAMELDKWLRSESDNWELGYKYELGGELESSGEANASIGVKLPIAFLIITLLLVIQFNSIRKPLIILFTIPMGVIGVVIGLLITRSYFGFMTLLGIISLAGIVINNAIVLIERIKIEIEENGLEPRRAIIEAAQRRMRPILLTTATTVGGLIPLWLGAGPMWKPMAISIIFGLIFATTLTLGVVPLLYSLLFRVKFKGFSYDNK